jgi:AcrR family transcriptional regulator
MSEDIIKRPYHSPLRKAQAKATRVKVLDAALGLFARHGYGATSIASVAREAGVVPETIYAAFGSKRGIIDGLVATALPPGAVAELQAAWAARAGDPRGQLSLVAAFAADFWSRNDALAAVFRQGTGDAEIGHEWSTRQAARRELLGGLVAAWPATDLRPGIDHRAAADLVWALASDELFHLLVRECGWTADRFRAWLADALVREVLAAARH